MHISRNCSSNSSNQCVCIADVYKMWALEEGLVRVLYVLTANKNIVVASFKDLLRPLGTKYKWQRTAPDVACLGKWLE